VICNIYCYRPDKKFEVTINVARNVIKAKVVKVVIFNIIFIPDFNPYPTNVEENRVSS